jgi:hypothetical protein
MSARPRRVRPELARACRSGTLGVAALCIGATSTMMSVERGIVDTNVLVYALDPTPRRT